MMVAREEHGMAERLELTEAEMSAACDSVWVTHHDPMHSASDMVRGIVDAINHQRTGEPAMCGDHGGPLNESCIRPVAHIGRGLKHTSLSAHQWSVAAPVGG